MILVPHRMDRRSAAKPTTAQGRHVGKAPQDAIRFIPIALGSAQIADRFIPIAGGSA